MAKIFNDKYYTPIELSNRCWEIVDEIIGITNITDIIEPSCGNGSFFHSPLAKPNIGIDILPEFYGENIIKDDYLDINIEYKKGRLVIGNPPYGDKMLLAKKFYRKSIEIGDYIAFILPISQLNNNQSLFEFDLIHSIDLGERDYSGVKLHCCFNIYKRPINGILNKRPSNKLKWVKIVRQDSNNYDKITDYDIRFCYWGNGSAGKIIEDDSHYAGEYKIKVSNECPFRDEVISFIKEYDWRSCVKCIAMRKIQQHHIVNIIKKHFNNIQ